MLKFLVRSTGEKEARISIVNPLIPARSFTERLHCQRSSQTGYIMTWFLDAYGSLVGAFGSVARRSQ